MNKKMGILLSAIIFLFPCAVRADIDFASIIQDKLSTVEEDVNKVLKQYTNIQVHIQEFRNNRDILKVIRDKAKQEIAAQKAKLIDKVRSQTVSLSGIGSNLNMGDFVGAELVSAVKSKYTKKANISNDFEEIRNHQKKINKMLVENVTTLYATALVRRMALQKEGETLDKKKEENKQTLANAQLGTIKDIYTETKNNADKRWTTVLKSTADFKGLIMNGIIAEGRISSEDEAISELEKAAQEQQAAADSEEPEVKIDVKGPTVGQLWDLGSKGINDVNSNNWWQLIEDAGGGYGTISGQSSTSSMIKIGAGAVAGAGKSGSNGSWNGALNALANGTNSIGNTSGMTELNDIADAVSGGVGLSQGGSANNIIDNATQMMSGMSGDKTDQANMEKQRQEDAERKRITDDFQKAMDEAAKHADELKNK